MTAAWSERECRALAWRRLAGVCVPGPGGKPLPDPRSRLRALPPSSLCSYKANDGSCVTCFGDGTGVGPNCDADYHFHCWNSGCYCSPDWSSPANA